ncbi:ECs_2282 family putative zinc-binding protein [Serratia quinivorans]|uniref:ECs_2282 family putative zinc-binding protein n=1 Tax=Serratia quinivorans TaxID=137545 RepID=UPI003F99A4CC
MDVKFTCPDCGSENIKTASEVKSLDEISSAICADCGKSLDRDEVIRQFKQFYLDNLKGGWSH